MISKLKYEYLLVIIATVWALTFAYLLQLEPYFSVTGDDTGYLNAAKLFYFKHQLHNIRPMLISVIIGFPYLFGFTTATVIKCFYVLNFCCWFATCLLLFKILKTRFSRKTAFYWAVFFLFIIGNLAHAFRFLADTLLIFILTLIVFFINRYFISKDAKNITIAISVAVLGSMVKPVFIGITGIMALFFVLQLKQILFNKYVVLLVFSLSILSYQLIGMKKQYGDYTISYIGVGTYYHFLGGKADCYRKNISHLDFWKNQRSIDAEKLSNHEVKILASKDFKEQLQNNTQNLIKAYLYCIYSNSSKGNYVVSECKNIDGTFYFESFRFLFKVISKLQNIIFTIITILLSFFILLKFKEINKYQLFLAVIVLYIFLSSAISCYNCDRLHLPIFLIMVLILPHFFDIEKLKLKKHAE